MSGPYENVQVSRLVTFLGTGNYSETVYRLAEREATRTAYVGRVLAELLKPRDVAVLATEEAEQRHGDGLKEALRAGNHPAPRFVRIPAGRAPAELWQQFEAIKAELRGSDGPVMLDITHGFRSQPFFAAAVATFVHAVDETPPNLHVCYAAYEAKDPNTGVAPIWDLSEFVALLSWSQALAMFLKTGRAEEAAKETQRLGQALAKAWAEGGGQGARPNLDALGKGLREFGADLETLRTGDLLLGRGTTKSSAARLLKATQETKKLAAIHAPPLADILDRVAAMAEPIAGAGHDLSGSEGRKTVIALAELYLCLGRYLEATATVREGWVNLYAPKAALVPAASNFDSRERKHAERRACEHDTTFREVTDRRNDLLHAQYRPSAQKAADITKAVENLVDKLRIASKTPRGACFLNLSNHPSANWDDAQTEAAFALAERIEDIAFPAVQPDADEKAVEALAETCMAQIPPETSHVLVQGEFTLTVELVHRLQVKGITCLAATSMRDVEEDAMGRRVSAFKFVRFRTYPEPRAE